MSFPYLQSRIRLERVRLKVQDGRLLMSPKDGIPDDVRAAMAAHREALMADLIANPEPPPTCCLCSAPLAVGRVYLCPQCQDAAAMKGLSAEGSTS